MPPKKQRIFKAPIKNVLAAKAGAQSPGKVNSGQNTPIDLSPARNSFTRASQDPMFMKGSDSQVVDNNNVTVDLNSEKNYEDQSPARNNFTRASHNDKHAKGSDSQVDDNNNGSLELNSENKYEDLSPARNNFTRASHNDIPKKGSDSQTQVDDNNNLSFDLSSEKHKEEAVTISTQDTEMRDKTIPSCASTQDMFPPEESAKEAESVPQSSSQRLFLQDPFLCSPIVVSTVNQTPTKKVKKTPKKDSIRKIINTPKQGALSKKKTISNLDKTKEDVQVMKRAKKTPSKMTPVKESPLSIQDTPSKLDETPQKIGTPRTSPVQIGTSRDSSAQIDTPDPLLYTPSREPPLIPHPITPFTPYSPYTPIAITPLICTPMEPMLSSQDYTPMDSKFVRTTKHVSTEEGVTSQMEGVTSSIEGASCSIESANVTMDTEMEGSCSQASMTCSQTSIRRNLMLNVRRPEIIKSILATCPPGLDQQARIEWLQEKRCVGVWAQCCQCEQFRFLPDIHDPCALPRAGWKCSGYPGLSCEVPVDEPSALEEEHFIEDAYNAGSVVMAKLDDFPWWPAMVDDDPNVEMFYWLDGLSDKPTKYHVTFFDSREVSRAWVSASRIKRYDVTSKPRLPSSVPAALRSRYLVADNQARQALQEKDLLKRLRKWSFVARYKGQIRPPKSLEELMPLIQKILKKNPSETV